MVRKKRKGVVKDTTALANDGSASASVTSVDLRRVVRELPQNVALAITITPAELPTQLKHLSIGAQVEDLAQWYDMLCSVSSIYDQLKMLQLFRSKCKAIGALSGGNEKESSNGDDAFVVATWRLMFRLYVAHEAEPLRKNFFLILEVLAIHHDTTPCAALVDAAAAELHLFLDKLFADHTTIQTPEQSVQALDLLLLVAEFPFLVRLLVNEEPSKAASSAYVLRFVNFCANQLALLAGPIVEYHSQRATTHRSQETASTNVVVVASERCGHALKNAILLATMKEMLYERLHLHITRNNSTGDQESADFLRILGHCVLILQTRVVHKDLLTQAGLAYCLLLRLLLYVSMDGDSHAHSITALLLQTIYPEQKISSIIPTRPRLRLAVECDMNSFGELSRLAVYRGMLNSFSDKELLSHPPIYQQRSVLDVIFATVQKFCKQEALTTRLYAFQVLEAFLRRAVLLLQRQNLSKDLNVLSLDTLGSLTTVILLNWEHPSKKVNQFMPPMFTHVVNYYILTKNFDMWKSSLVAKLIDFPLHSRGKYGALTIMLNEYGAQTLLQEYPTLLEQVLAAVGHKDVSAAAANLFAQILDELNSGSTKGKRQATSGTVMDKQKEDWRQLWIGKVVEVLLSTNMNLRTRVSMYVTPLLLKKDPECIIPLIDRLREAAQREGVDHDVALWAIIEILKFARKRLAPEKLLGVTTAEIEEGLQHAKAETRNSAFDALCTSLKSTNLPSTEELLLIKKFLVMSAKEISPAARMNTMIRLKNIFIRIKESSRINATRSVKNSGDVHAKQQEELKQAHLFKHWVELFVVSAVYPGSIPQRTIIGLEVMVLYLQVFGLMITDEDASNTSMFMSAHMTTALLNMLISSWDAIRSLTYSILDLYPEDLPGYTSKEELESLLKWSIALCVSPRQRESDAGALFIRLLFKRSEKFQEFGIEFSGGQPLMNLDQAIHSADVSFVLKLTDVILGRLDNFSSDDIRKGDSPFVHGLLLSLRYIMENIDFTQLAIIENHVLVEEWRTAMHRIFLAIQRSMRLSLSVVGDATSGIGDEELSVTFTGVVGEVSAAAKSAPVPLRVDCRGHLILDDAEGNDGDDDMEQRAVVGSWQAARECGAILDTFMRRVPLPRANDANSGLITTDMAKQGGETLLNSLFELKHKGAVAMAYQSFEGICRSFLAHGEKNALIGGLPSLWADRLLDRLEKSEQHFILRRSSGFAYSFVAILRAEPRNSAAVILPKVMTNLLRLAGQDTDSLATSASSQHHHALWRSRVHALNILKLICQDAVLADDVAVYISQMLEIAVFGFDCGSWAVRNSSMMLFAAATQRAIGDKRIADGASKLKVSSTDVFSRFPQLNGFLYRILEKYLAQDWQQRDKVLANGMTPPGLYPVLMFMSRLKPGDEDEEVEGEDNKPLSDFLPLIMQCASQPTMAIRQMSAKVLATIVRDTEAVHVLSKLVAQLPKQVKTRDVAKNISAPFMTNNFVHGVLTQIKYLVAKYLDPSIDNVSNEPRTTAERQILETVIRDLVSSKIWFWTDAKLACGSIRAVFLEIVNTIVKYYSIHAIDLSKNEFAEQLQSVIHQIREQCEEDLQKRCSVQEDGSSAGVPSSQTIGCYVSDRTLVSIFFNLWKSEIQLRSGVANTIHAHILMLLQSRVLEIRKRSIKQLSNAILGVFGFQLTLTKDDNLALRRVLVRQLLEELHPIVKVRHLQLVVHIQLLVNAPFSKKITPLLQKKLFEIVTNAVDADLVAPALELMALLVQLDHTSNVSLCQQLAKEIVLHTSEKQPLVLRHAAAKAIRYSQLLLIPVRTLPKDNALVNVAFDCWMSVIKLLQDDDEQSRSLACEAIHVALQSVNKDIASLLTRNPSDTQILPYAVQYVAGTFAATPFGYAKLSTMLHKLTNATAFFEDATSKVAEVGDLSSRIFEAESNNYYAEPDLVAQLYVFHMLFMDSSLESDETKSKTELRVQLLTKLVTALQQLSAPESRDQWLGGITYYSAAFSTFFSLLSAGVAIVITSEGDKGESDLTQQLSVVAKRLRENVDPLHPFIHTALKILIAPDEAEGDEVMELLFLTPYWKALEG